MNYESIRFDCKYFKGDIPCVPNKLNGAICNSCEEYKPIEKKILIIKLGAIGDVIRTTPLLEKYYSIYPDAQITWLTHFPDILPANQIHKILKADALQYWKLAQSKFDIVINLDKDEEACRLLDSISATEKYGYSWTNGHLSPATDAAKHKILTGAFDEISKKNTKSYLEEIFEICHFDFNKEAYQIRRNSNYSAKWKIELQNKAQGKKIIALNTGCGPRWKTRLWLKTSWIELVEVLQKNDFFPIILGGKQEHEDNLELANESGAFYPGHFSLEEFIELTSNCDVVVTQVSMMMHIATALQKPMVLMNNIFNKHEFELYGRGVLVEPSSGCDCYFDGTCSRSETCMKDISVDTIFTEIKKL